MVNLKGADIPMMFQYSESIRLEPGVWVIIFRFHMPQPFLISPFLLFNSTYCQDISRVS
jgi:hypothetical protein